MWILLVAIAVLFAIVIYDVTQTRHAILRNFPVIGHFRYLLETVGPELRQYIVTSNDEERPFSRDQRTWIYSSAKKENNYYSMPLPVLCTILRCTKTQANLLLFLPF